jgi:hypothetical protein
MCGAIELECQWNGVKQKMALGGYDMNFHATTEPLLLAKAATGTSLRMWYACICLFLMRSNGRRKRHRNEIVVGAHPPASHHGCDI